MIQSSREARNTSYLVCILQFPSLISDGTYSITSIFAALSNERIYDLGPTYNWRVLIERPLMSTSAPRFVLLRTNEMSWHWHLNNNFVWPKSNPLVLKGMRTKQIGDYINFNLRNCILSYDGAVPGYASFSTNSKASLQNWRYLGFHIQRLANSRPSLQSSRRHSKLRVHLNPTNDGCTKLPCRLQSRHHALVGRKHQHLLYLRRYRNCYQGLIRLSMCRLSHKLTGKICRAG